VEVLVGGTASAHGEEIDQLAPDPEIAAGVVDGDSDNVNVKNSVYVRKVLMCLLVLLDLGLRQWPRGTGRGEIEG
jgi:hypothetical protein